MKGVFVIIDGVADEKCKILSDKTPLEVAKTPNLDELARKSMIEHCYPIGEGIAPESSGAVVSLLGYDPNFAPRGPLEAQGVGIKFKKGDLVLRTNFATIDNLQEGNLIDSRAGRTLTTKEARILAKAINEHVHLPYPFEIYSTVQHRGVLVIRGGFSDNISNADPNYENGIVSKPKGKIVFSEPLDDDDDSKLSANLVNSFIRRSFEVLDKHPLNLQRAKKGLFSANFILARDAGNEPIKFKKLEGKWMALGYMPLEKGIAKAAGMEVYDFKYPEMKDIDVYANLYKGLESAIKYSIKMLKKYKDKYDYFYVHLKETDIPGHDNHPLDKVKMIEIIDKKFFSFLKNFIGENRLIVTADHTTSSKLKVHTAAPVPVLIYPREKGKGEESEKRFTEADGMKGKKIMGRKLLEKNLLD